MIASQSRSTASNALAIERHIKKTIKAANGQRVSFREVAWSYIDSRKDGDRRHSEYYKAVQQAVSDMRGSGSIDYNDDDCTLSIEN